MACAQMPHDPLEHLGAACHVIEIIAPTSIWIRPQMGLGIASADHVSVRNFSAIHDRNRSLDRSETLVPFEPDMRNISGLIRARINDFAGHSLILFCHPVHRRTCFIGGA